MFILVSGCANDNRDAGMIHEAHRGFIAAFNVGDLDRAFGYLTDDFAAMVERQPTMDKNAYRMFVSPFLESNRTDFSFEVDEIIVADDWAFERVRYRGEIAPKSGGPANAAAWRALVVWKRTPDGWRIARYVRTPDPPRSDGG